MSRRALFVTGSGRAGRAGGLGAAGFDAGLVEAGVLPGSLRPDRALGRCDVAAPVPAEIAVL